MWVMFISKISDTLEIESHSLFNFSIIIPRCGFHFRSTDFVDKDHSQDYGSICKQTWNKSLFRPDAPTSNRRRLYCIKIKTRRDRCECSDWLTHVPKQARRVYRLDATESIWRRNTRRRFDVWWAFLKWMALALKLTVLYCIKNIIAEIWAWKSDYNQYNELMKGFIILCAESLNLDLVKIQVTGCWYKQTHMRVLVAISRPFVALLLFSTEWKKHH